MTTTDTPTVRPTGLTGRAPAPDLARGFMLLFIALANTPFYLYGREQSEAGFHPVDGPVYDKVVQAVTIIVVDLRAYPMLAVLFGYGLVMIYRRQQEAGRSERDAFRLLQRRNLWLLVFGAVHALLLSGGDVLGAYGLCGLLMVWLFLRRSDRALKIVIWIGTGLLVALAALTAFSLLSYLAADDPVSTDGGGALPEIFFEDATSESYLTTALVRIMTWPMMVLLIQGPVTLVVPVSILVSVLLARHRVLKEPGRHRRLLRTLAVTGIGIAWVGALPHALAHIGVIEGLDDVIGVFAAIQLATGLAGGVGYAALFGLIGHRVSARSQGTLGSVGTLGPVGSAISALGKRSMTGYLAQSVIFTPLLAAWGFGLGASLTSTTMALVAVGGWLVTVALAVAMERRNYRGPAETLMRRLVYRPTKQ